MRSLALGLVVVAACGKVPSATVGGDANPNGSDGGIAKDASGPGPDMDAGMSPFPSNGSGGAFAPNVNTVLPAGVYQFTTIDIPAGIKVTTNGIGELELRAQGDVVIAGTIDLSGSIGGGPSTGFGGGGGATAMQATIGAAGTSTMCPVGGSGGIGALGSPTTGTACGGNNATTSGGFGGGAGGQFQAGGGAGGGGYAGGGGGRGGAGASMDGTGGATSSAGGNGGEPGGGVYAGATASCGGPGECNGGGGSIGSGAINDLAVATTFRPGSGGGGGSAPVSTEAGTPGGAGGGGGGGALRIATSGTITIASTGVVRADGGAGGPAPAGMAAGLGGGGSGGVVYLSAPRLTVAGTISAAGGIPGGGLGRIRISTAVASCNLTGTFMPPLSSSCNAASAAGAVYIAEFPN